MGNILTTTTTTRIILTTASKKMQLNALAKATGLDPQMMLALALANGAPIGDLEVERKGKKIILPEGMSYEDAIEWCQRMIKEENETVAINEEIDAWPFDGAIALMKAMKETFGWSSLVPTPTFWGPRPPTMLSVPISKNETLQVPWGRMEIPNINGFISTGLAFKDDRLLFKIGGEVKQKHKAEIHDLANEVRRIVATDSIYKGKAIKIKFPDDPKEFNPWDFAPNFMDLTNVKPSELIFRKDLQKSIKDNLFTPIEHTDRCRKQGIPLKRGVLMAGPYGTGKTLTANVLALLCEENGWTYVYLRNSTHLAQAVDFAKRYQPAVIFSEDIDQALAGERDNNVNKILNVVDGIDAKGSEIMVVLTTNHIEKIQQAMLRPGRLDAVISLSYPDAEAAAKLLRLYGRGLIRQSENLDRVGQLLDGTTPAVLREVVERSKLSAIGRNNGETDFRITADDLEVTAKSIKDHLELLKPKGIDNRSNSEKLGDSMGKRVVEGMLQVVKQPAAAVKIPAKVTN